MVQRNFLGPTYNVNEGRPVDRFIMGGWDNNDDVLQMAILYFIHSFVLSQFGDAATPIEDFLMEVPGFEDFSSKPPKQLLRRSTRVVGAGSTPPPKRRKVAHPPKTNVPKATQPYEQRNQPFQTPNSQTPQADNVDNKIGALEVLIKENHSELMKAVSAEDNKSEKHVGGISMPHIVDDSIEKGNVDPQPTSDQFFQQPISPIQMDFATLDHDIDVPAVEVEKQYGTDERLQRYVSDT
ncbi:hypothetical protein H5410_005838 [Solanum commersonii]|uniref:Uncharacterized protein n=1 Tax=Solanum commersonii TaxID=4109 RepID=A0A9J6A8M0_SOLCO|nr:hypothetical protein H5410_005838 [Solanum commersonii]